MERTVKLHVSHVRRFLLKTGKTPTEVTDEDIRSYLSMFRGMSPRTYANNLISLRVFFRDFMGRGEIVQSFRLPKGPHVKPKVVPTREELRRFYDAIDTLQGKVAFLMFASTGLRRRELLSVRLKDINIEKRMILPQDGGSRTKRTWVTFFNEEAAQVLTEYLNSNGGLTPESKVLPSDKSIRLAFEKARRKTGIRITPQVLREWFACEMGRLGVADRYVDAFCGRVPKSVLARYYTDFSPERLKEIYDSAGLRVLV